MYWLYPQRTSAMLYNSEIPNGTLGRFSSGCSAGCGIPQRKIEVQRPEQADSAILQMLLAPGRDMVQLSYLTWIADQQPVIEESLRDLINQLDQALIFYHGELVKPAQQLLAYAHQMMGKIAFDRLDLTAASGHFTDRKSTRLNSS